MISGRNISFTKLPNFAILVNSIITLNTFNRQRENSYFAQDSKMGTLSGGSVESVGKTTVTSKQKGTFRKGELLNRSIKQYDRVTDWSAGRHNIK